ncbi:secretin and TonB N-terminal domain-containing protein [candidate division TA06 bacterium]|nr:secretin and TonB N-terminal domain-containing protein [candidate division TA06 bacterium]
MSSLKKPYVLSLSVILLFLASASHSQNLQDIIVRNVELGTEVLLKSGEPFEFQDLTTTGSDRVVLDLKGVGSLLSGESYPVNRGGVMEANLSSFRKQNFVRVVLVTMIPIPYEVRMDGNDLLVTFLMGPQEPFEEWRASEVEALHPPPLPIPKVVEKPKPKPRLIPKPKPNRPAPSPRKRARGPSVTLDLEDADLLTVLRGLSEVSGVDIVAGKGVKGTITIRLRDKPWREALDLILKATGFDFVIEKGVIRIATPGDLAREREERELASPLMNQIYRIEFATAAEILAPIQKTLTKRGHAEQDVRTNSLIVTDIPDNFSRIEKLIQILDSRTPQVEIQAKIIDINTQYTRELGLRWELTGLESRKINLRGGVTIGDTIANPTINIGTIRDFARVDAVLKALEIEGKARTVANPRMVASNNQKATIFAGTRITITSTNIQGVVTIQSFDAGTRLEVTPHINSLEEITLDIRTEVNSVDFSRAVQNIPIIITNEAQTKQLVRDGETMVMGGLITTTESEIVTGVPILKDIPLIGALFKSTTKATTEREVLIFITPRIIKRGGKS